MRRWVCRYVAATIFLFACAPPGADHLPPAPTELASSPSLARPSRLVVAIQNDVSVLATKFQVGPGVAGGVGHDLSALSNNPLVVLDDHGMPQPRLASAIPSRDSGTWTLNPNGTMTTTWTIRPNAQWHDGKPVTSADFTFAFKLYMDPEIQVIHRSPERLIERIEPLDDKSFVIHWNQLYRGADRLIVEQLEPLPAHILAALYDQGDRAAFQNAPFWTTPAYVGNGPYVLTERVEGVQRTYRAFDQYMLGKPKTDEIVVLMTPDQNVVLANVLAGTVDVTTSTTLNQQAGLTLQREWVRTGEGYLVNTLGNFIYGEFQHNPERVQQPALLDLRVRQAIILAIDRASLNEVVSGGRAPTPQLPMHTEDPWYSRVLQAAPPYAYDVARSLQLLEDAGWTRRGTALTDAGGEAFKVNVRTVGRADNETVVRIWASYLSDLGMSVTQTTLSVAEDSDREQRATFPGLGLNAIGTMEMPDGMADFIGEDCPKAENRYVGRNRRCWNNQEFDRFFKIASGTMDDEMRANSTAQMLRLLMQDAAMIPLTYYIHNIAVRKGIVGVAPHWHTQKGASWFVHQWSWS